MAYKYYTIQEIIEWYSFNAEKKISVPLIQHMINEGMIVKLPNKHFSLNEINNLLLKKEDCDFVKNEEGKYIFKENRKKLLNIFKEEEIIENGKFTIKKIEGNKLKLIKNQK